MAQSSREEERDQWMVHIAGIHADAAEAKATSEVIHAEVKTFTAETKAAITHLGERIAERMDRLERHFEARDRARDRERSEDVLNHQLLSQRVNALEERLGAVEEQLKAHAVSRAQVVSSLVLAVGSILVAVVSGILSVFGGKK